MSEGVFQQRMLLPAGTKVRPLVSRTCTVGGKRSQIFSGHPGVIIRSAKDVYSRLLVRFDDEGAELAYLPHEVVPIDAGAECPFDLRSAIVLKTRIGSHAHGIAHEESDDDIRGVFVSPSDLHWALHYTPRRIEFLQDGLDELYYEIGGFVRRLLTGDPMAMETLFSDLVLEADEVGQFLIDQRQRFLTRPALLGFPIFLRDQMRKLNRKDRKGHRVKSKALMHSLRLAISGLRALETGELTLEAREYADIFVEIREGEWAFERVNQEVHRCLRRFDEVLNDSPLPAEPATIAADDCLIYSRGHFARRWIEKNPTIFKDREGALLA